MKPLNTRQLVRKDLRAHIYSGALLSNLNQLKSICRESVKFCAVVKANAYGHGLIEVVNILKSADVDFFAVASMFEAVHIAGLVQNQSILVFEPIHPGLDAEMLEFCAEKNVHCTVASIEAAEYASKTLGDTGNKLNVHINVETGMGRCGIDTESARILIDKVDAAKNLHLAGVFTHFATADEEDLSFAYEQLADFNRFVTETLLNTRKDVLIHAANSAAAIKMPQAHFDMVRCGVSLYGYYSRPQPNGPIELKPVMKLQAPVIQFKKIPKGKAVSYGRSFVTKRDTTAAVIPLGYADGYWRCFSNRAKMKIGDSFVPVIGRVCMDQLLIDVTDVADVHLGQMVTIIDNAHNSACGVYALADLADTICYEILTCVHAHVSRIVH